MQRFHNSIELIVRSGETGEEKAVYKDNAISDDFLVTAGKIYGNNSLSSFSFHNQPTCFLLPDDPIPGPSSPWALWTLATGGTLPRLDPWAPYCYSLNNVGDATADELWKPKGSGSPGYTAPSSATGFRHKLFYTWSQLPFNIQLKAVGLTDMQPEYYNEYAMGLVGNGLPAIFVPQALVVLPQSILVHGRLGGTQTPDILEISYFLSVVGAS
jgi:hypothetical protein